MPEQSAQLVEIYREISQILLSTRLDADVIAKRLLEEAVDITGAEFGAYFRSSDLTGEPAWEVTCVVGAEVDLFTRMGKPRMTDLFAPTFQGQHIVRSDDVFADPRYGALGGMPRDHLPVTSYLAAPVTSSTGKPRGAMLFGHSRPGVFDATSEILIQDIATIGSMALDNAYRFAELQKEIEYRQLLLAELNHRVKNTLATVQGMINSTLRSTPDPEAFAKAVTGRVHSIAATHNLLTETNWMGAQLMDVLEAEVSHYRPITAHNIRIGGPKVMLQASAVTGFGMVIHELTTNSIKYGALSDPDSQLDILWHLEARDGERRLILTWEERGGPSVEPPQRKGFGTRLLTSIERQFNGQFETYYDSDGFRCRLDVPMAQIVPGTEPAQFLIRHGP